MKGSRRRADALRFLARALAHVSGRDVEVGRAQRRGEQHEAESQRAFHEAGEPHDARDQLLLPFLDLAGLAALPAGSFGNELARYFDRNKIHPFLTTFAITSDEVYLAKRYRETHDLLHVITGYETHMLGEI